MKNHDARNLLKKTVVVAITGVSILNISACGKADDAVPVAQTAEVIESTVAEEEFTWEDRDLDEALWLKVANQTHIYSEPRVTSEVKGDLAVGDELEATAEAYQGETQLGFSKVAEGYVDMSDASYIIQDAVYSDPDLQEQAGIDVLTMQPTEPQPEEKPQEQAKADEKPSKEAEKPADTPTPAQDTPPAEQPQPTPEPQVQPQPQVQDETPQSGQSDLDARKAYLESHGKKYHDQPGNPYGLTGSDVADITGGWVIQ